MDDGITLERHNREKSSFKMVKYHVFVILILGILGLFLFFVGKFGNDALPFVIFIIFISVPILVTFKDNLPDYIPKPIRNFLTEDIEKPKGAREVLNVNFQSTKTKQIYYIVGMTVLAFAVILLLVDISPDLKKTTLPEVLIKNGTLTKIISGLFLTIILGVLLMKFNELSSRHVGREPKPTTAASA